jgi:hypothetical protein
VLRREQERDWTTREEARRRRRGKEEMGGKVQVAYHRLVGEAKQQQVRLAERTGHHEMESGSGSLIRALWRFIGGILPNGLLMERQTLL